MTAVSVVSPGTRLPSAGDRSFLSTAYESPRAPEVGPSIYGVFEGQNDEDLLAPLRDGKIARVKFNQGGSSLSLRIDFDNGARAAFKPRQTNLQTVPRKEVAAYRLNRLLGLSSVQPAIGRAFDRNEILDALDPTTSAYGPRLRAEMVAVDGVVTGELSWWIPKIRRPRIGDFEIDTTEGIVSWKRLLMVGSEIPESEFPLVSQIADMLLFDYLTDNPDRWSGGNARISDDGERLYFMDNTLSFGTHPKGHRKVRLYLRRSQKFSRSLVAQIRNLTELDLRAALDKDRGAFEFLLDDEEISSLMSRRQRLLDYVDELIGEHGEEKVLVFP